MFRMRHSLFWLLAAAVVLPPLAPPPAAHAADTKTTTDVVPVFTLKSVNETPMPEDPIFGAVGQESLIELVRRMDKAAKDPNVKAVILLLDSPSFGFGQIEEVRQAIGRLKEAKKPVYAHADSMTTGTYALLCGATRLSVSPTSDVFLTGIYSEQMYLKGLFDKLKIQPDFLTCGAYKSAAEMFMRSGPSPEAKSMYDWLYDGMYATVVDLIAKGRGVEPAKAKEWIDQGLYSAESAKKAGLIDDVEFRQDFQAYVKSQAGDAAKLEAKYGKPKGLDLDLNNPFAAMQLWAQILAGPQVKKSNKDAVAIVYVDGPIMLGKAEASPFGGSSGAFSEPIRKALDEAARDDKVKAVVLRVDSPGGSAIASEIILNATKRVKEKKPLVVSMGNVAGSGGYYVACGSDTIFADTATITGSIGVVSGKLATTEMWEQFGISFSANARGKKAGILSSGTKFTDDERKEMQAWMDEVYGVFKGHVTKIRGERLKKPIDDLAGGRVFTGQQGLELGLVDKIGTLSDAIAFAASSAKITDYDLRMLPKKTNFLEELLGDVQGHKKDEQYLSTPAVSGFGAGNPLGDALLPVVKSLDPQRASLVRQAFLQLQILHSERVSLTMPVFGVSP
ncbi:MAG TPA: signal peptide peptidase SppA [Caulifigura sp.]|nr:signal peptide peptidase SppA [Caulifigura sp.]